MTNWTEYNNRLRQRGDITIWFTEAAIAEWHPIKTGVRGTMNSASSLKKSMMITPVSAKTLRDGEHAKPGEAKPPF